MRPLGVVLVRLRDPESGHDRITGELFDEATVRLDAARDVFEVLVHAPADDLGVAGGYEIGGVDQVHEKDGRESSLHTVIVGGAAPAPGGRASRAMRRRPRLAAAVGAL
jgi:hypothetical protein